MLWRPLRDALHGDAAAATQSPRDDELAAQITRGLGGDARQQPRRWAAASLAQHAGQIRTPLLLIYADGGDLSAQAEAWRSALAAAGVEHKLITVDGADHAFSSGPAQRRLHKEVTGWFRRAA